MSTTTKALYGSSTALTITLASLAAGTIVGRQSTLVDNTTNAFSIIHVYYKFTLGALAVSRPKNAINIYPFFNDGGSHTDYGAGASDAAFTFTPPLLIPPVASVLALGDTLASLVLQGSFTLINPGPKWGLIVTQNTGDVLDATAGNHWIKFVGENQITA